MRDCSPLRIGHNFKYNYGKYKIPSAFALGIFTYISIGFGIVYDTLALLDKRWQHIKVS